MDKERSIMLCLESLGIGGVETAVINQAITLVKKGYTVIVLAKKDIYTELLEQNNVKCIDFIFENKNYFDYKKIKEIINIINEYNVKEIHINHFTLMTVLIPACFLTNTPYITYLHMASSIIDNEELNVYNWFEKSYPIYKELFKLLFSYSSKIVAITSTIAEYTANRYNIDKENIIVIPNSIDFESYKCKKKLSKIKNVLIICRLNKEKLQSIFAGIDFFIELNNVLSEKLHLNIAGDGIERDIVRKYILDKNIDEDIVTFLGVVANIPDIIEENDIVIGVDRCILEAIAMKRIAVVSGYNGKLKGFINKENIQKEKEENFCGNNLNDVNTEELAKEISLLNENKISEIVNSNYDFARENLNINKNICINIKNFSNYNKNFDDIIEKFIIINNKLGIMYNEAFFNVEKNWKEHLEYKEWMESKLNELVKEYNLKIDELNSIYYSRTYKIMQKVRKLLKKR